MILEGIVTTQNSDGSINIAPMGPIVDESFKTLWLRPFQTSTTYGNLKRQRCGVFHVIDDACLLARAAIDCWETFPATFAAETIRGNVLANACRWYEFTVQTLDEREPRTTITVEVVHVGRIRDFWGWNRAKHAVLEAAILATRVHLLEPQDIRQQMQSLRISVEKTAGPREREAFELLMAYIENHHRGAVQQ